MGLFSVSGVKFTTARRVAEKTLQAICRHMGRREIVERPVPRPELVVVPSLRDIALALVHDEQGATRQLRKLVGELAVVEPEDFLLRRVDWGLEKFRVPSVHAALANACERRLGF